MHAHAENRTAAYRWCRSLGLPCAMVGRLMPRSPGSRTFLWPPSPFELTMPSTRLGSRASSIRLDRSNDGQDHTVLPYARPAMSPQYFQPCRRSRKLTGETKPSSAARPHAATGSQGLPALPAPLVPTLPRPPQARLAIKTTSRSPLLVSRDQRHIRQNRISVKWNIFGEAG